MLIADSGSTKTNWCWKAKVLETQGINPVRDSDEAVRQVLDSLPPMQPRHVYFYGAGCIPPYGERLRDLLHTRFPEARIVVESDMLGAARALCQYNEGIACILGTGSNSCLYDGERILSNVSPLGYILGDEGSGAVLGRTLISDLLKGQLGDALREAFLEEFNLTPAEIINKVYREPMPNRFLASLTPFLARHRHAEGIHHLIITEFSRFLQRNVSHYQRPDLPLHFSGGIAHAFAPELHEAVAQAGYHIGNILRHPIEELAKFHTCKGEK